NPFLTLPSGNVRINSDLPDNSNGVSTIGFGGNPASTVGSTSTTVQLANQLSWFSENNRHRLKLSTELRRESFAQDFTSNTRGTFGYNSLGDLEADHPATF